MKPIDILFLVVGVLVGAAALYGIFTQIEPRGPVLRVVEMTPVADEIAVGEDYKIDVVIDKYRNDCANGHITRHMYEINTGKWYRVYDRAAFQLPKGIHPFHLKIGTRPLDLRDNHMMSSGTWVVQTVVSYQCPGDDGNLEVIDYQFATPHFKVKDRWQK